MNLIGVESVKEMIIQAKKENLNKNNKNIKYINKDITKMKFKKSDLITSCYTIQFINPKSVVVSMTVVSTFIDAQNNYVRDFIVVTTIGFFVAVFSISSWCLLGKYLRKFVTSDRLIKNFNYTMSFLLIVCVILFYV